VLWWYDPETGKRTKLLKEALGLRLDAMEICSRRNPKLLLVIIADGAEWIWNWARKYEKAIKLLDYYHLRENVNDAAKVLYGEQLSSALDVASRLIRMPIAPSAST